MVLTVLGWVEVSIAVVLGLRPDAVAATIAGPIAALSHDTSLALALPIPVWTVLFGLGVLGTIRIGVFACLSGRSWRDWLAIWCAGLVITTPIGMAQLAFGLTGVPYLWLAAAVFGVLLTVALAGFAGQRGPALAMAAPLVATLGGGIATLLAVQYALAVMVLTIPVVAAATVVSFTGVGGDLRGTGQPVDEGRSVREGPSGTRGLAWGSALVRILAGFGLIMGATGLLYLVLKPSSQAPPEIQAQLEAALASDDPVRVIFVDGFNTSRSSLPWLGTDHPATWFSYAGFTADGEPKPYGALDTLSGIHTNVQPLADQVKRESAKGEVVLVGISQGTWIIEMVLHYHPALRPKIRQVVLIDTPISLDWIDIHGPITTAGLHSLGALVRLVTPVTIDPHGPLATALTDGSLPDTRIDTKVPTVWLRSVMDAAKALPPIGPNAQVVTYWGAHALTIGLPTGRAAIGRIVDGDTRSQPGSQGGAAIMAAIAGAWQLPTRVAATSSLSPGA